MRECILFVGQHLSPFELEGSFGSFVNVSVEPNVEAPFLSSHFIPLVSLSQLTFFNISTANDACSPSTATSTQTTCFLSSCSFSSVCDVYDGGIVHSLNNPLASLSVSNTSFIGCCRTRNVECEGTEDVPLKPGRHNETENGSNSFIWCEWDGSKTTGAENSYSDGVSSGGAICMFSQTSASVSVSHCSFNNCCAHYGGGGINFFNLKSVEIVNNTFDSCVAQNYRGGGICIFSITNCVRISGCEFRSCLGNGYGGGLYLDNFYVSDIGCVGTEYGKGESACLFDCCFTSCSVANSIGGGIFCYNVPAEFKMRSTQFISCWAKKEGGGLELHPNRTTAPDDGIYCLFLFFHGCSCLDAANPRGHDVEYVDTYDVYLNAGNPFFECYTTNTNDKRICFAHNYANEQKWTYDETSKKDWLKRGILNRFVAVSGGGEEELCGLDESSACRTIGVAVDKSVIQVNLNITLMGGNHTSETATIEIGTKKISVIGKGRMESSIEMKSLSSTGSLFSVSTGHLGIEIKVKAPENFESSCLIDVQSKCSMRNIKFCIPYVLSGASSSSLITSNSTLLTLTDCSVVCSSENPIGYCFANVVGGKVKVEGLVIRETLIFGEHSLIEFSEGVESVVFCGCEVNNIEKRSGDGGWVSGVVGAERDEGKNGIIVIESCVVKGCRCVGGRGGGMNVVVNGEGSVVVNGSCVIDGCEAKGSGESSGGRSEGRGGG
eukprot:MONOS_10502.1-p1 / transcript=MONOS_10502.1 / gene=MONOS_10502 / organism=Monocercomonoides_exilis_PA203 / gene_product=unspecified product / transcript_product=unspecified product / location=Mono_scaffold00480:21880-24642(+) / protein_length=720 / sequence_SO=supercontig / SO=protein_coding / is_pseudo=false